METDTPPIDALRLVSGFRAYQLLVAACELKLPDLIAGGLMEVGELAKATGTHAPSLRRLLRGLAAWGIVAEGSDHRFGPTALSERFRSDKPGLRNTTLMLNDEGYRVWGDLLYAVRTGKPAHDHIYGKSRFEMLGENPEAAARFNAAMIEATLRVARAFVDVCDFSGVETVVDVGGGNGALIAAVLHAHPNMRGVLFDLAQGLLGARERLESTGIDERVSLIEGSFFESVPSNGDLYLLKSIVHDWDDERALLILKTCRRAFSPTARLVLVERIIPERVDESPTGFQAVMADLQMMVVLGGRERTPAEFEGLLAQAGFRMTRVVPVADQFHAVEAVPV